MTVAGADYGLRIMDYGSRPPRIKGLWIMGYRRPLRIKGLWIMGYRRPLRIKGLRIMSYSRPRNPRDGRITRCAALLCADGAWLGHERDVAAGNSAVAARCAAAARSGVLGALTMTSTSKVPPTARHPPLRLS